MPGVSEWLGNASEAVERAKQLSPDAAPADLLTSVIEQNVLLQIEHLQSYPEVREKLASGKLRMHAWIYHFETGEVTAYDAAQQRFVPLSSSPRRKIASADGQSRVSKIRAGSTNGRILRPQAPGQGLPLDARVRYI